jgi:hypothetical protein
MPDIKQLSNLARTLLLAVTLCYSMLALAEEAVVTQPAPEPEPETVPIVAETPPVTAVPDVFDPLESTRNYLSSGVTRFASYIDSYFGGNEHFQERNTSVMHVDLSRATGYGGTAQYDLSASLNLRLPISEGRLHLLIETDPERILEDEPLKSSTVLNTKPATKKSIALAARYALEQKNNWSFRTDVGIKFPLPPRPFVRSKIGYSTPIDDWRLNIGESVYWFNDIGVGETTQMDLERQVRSSILFRATSISTWLKDQQNFDMSQSFSFIHTVSDRTSLIYQASVFGISEPAAQISDTVLLVFYRYRMHQKWLYFEFSPQLHFPRVNDYKASPAMSMRLQMLFDDGRESD